MPNESSHKDLELQSTQSSSSIDLSDHDVFSMEDGHLLEEKQYRWMSILHNNNHYNICGRRIGKTTLIVCLILVIPILTIIIFHPSSSKQAQTELPKPPYFFDKSKYDDNIHLIIPLSDPHPLFCRPFFSALTNAYPPPHLVGFKKAVKPGLSKIADKINNIYDFLSKVPDKDIVVMVDGHDVYFQLPLDILVQRFKNMGGPVYIGAEKNCYPGSPDSPQCADIPQSPFASDIYGEDTDKIRKGDQDDRSHFRPRWINTGSFIGYAKHLRDYYSEAKRRLDKMEGLFTDQGLLAEVFQEWSIDENNNGHLKLDYAQSLFMTMYYAWEDVAFIQNPSENLMASTYSTSDIPVAPLDLDGLDMSPSKGDDITQSPWYSRNLAWNTIFNAIPVVLHFNGPHGGTTKQRENVFWKRMWYAKDGKGIEATLKADGNQIPGKAGAWAGDQWVTYNYLCGLEDIWKDVENP